LCISISHRKNVFKRYLLYKYISQKNKDFFRENMFSYSFLFYTLYFKKVYKSFCILLEKRAFFIHYVVVFTNFLFMKFLYVLLMFVVLSVLTSCGKESAPIVETTVQNETVTTTPTPNTQASTETAPAVVVPPTPPSVEVIKPKEVTPVDTPPPVLPKLPEAPPAPTVTPKASVAPAPVKTVPPVEVKKEPIKEVKSPITPLKVEPLPTTKVPSTGTGTSKK
jgi:hypothetical protein